ncbi:MAG: hypothetical protein H8E98_03030 [Bacteroidetes bacterium]|nr:hypothetical protein [Bacteroidota bacterium]
MNEYIVGAISFVVGCIITYLLITKAYKRALRRLIQEINLKSVVIEKLKNQLKIKDTHIYDKEYKARKNEKSKR